MTIDERELLAADGRPDGQPVGPVDGLPDAVDRRALVPSAREGAGVPPDLDGERGADALLDERPDRDGRARAERQSLRDIARAWRPRAIAGRGPIMPLVVLGLFSLVTQWDDAAIGVVLPEMRADFRVDVAFLVSLGAFLSLLQEATAPVFGYLADRINRVWMLRIGSIVANASSVVTGLASGIPMLLLGRAGSNIGGAVRDPVGLPLVADYYPSDSRYRVFSFFTAVGYVGAAIGPLLGGWLAAVYGWRWSVAALGGVALAVSLLAFLLREPARGYQDRIEQGADEAVARRAQPPVGWSEGWRTAASVTTIRRLWFSAPFVFAIGVALLGMMSLYYAEEFGVGATGRGFIATLNALVALPALALAGPVGDRILRRNPGRLMGYMGGALVLQALAFAVLWITPSLGLAIAVNLTIAFLNVVFVPAFFSLLSLTTPARIRGLGAMTLGPWRALGRLIVPLMFAVAGTGGLRPVMLLLVPVTLVAAAILGTASAGVARDIRAAKAAAMAEEESRRAREAGRTKLLVCRDVEVHYDGVQVLDGVDLDVGDGELVALLGTNGAGKSTLLRAIAGVTEASSGAIFFDERDITHVPPHEVAARGVVMLPGGRAVFPTLTVRENLRAAAWLRRDDPDIARASEEVLGMFPALRERLDVQAGSMSGGEQQQLALGQAFLMRPRLLAIDELSLGLSPKIVEQLLATLRRIHAAGTTIVLVEQSVNLALTIAERAVFMEKGRIVFDGPTAELLGRGDVIRSVFLGGAVTGRDLTRPRDRARRDDEARTVLEARDLTVRFGGVTAIDGVSLSLAEREIVGIIGANGAGKSTLFDAISGFAPLDAGSVLLDGADVTALRPDERARLGLTRSFQNVRLFPTMTVREAVAVAFERHLDDQNALKAMAWAPKLRAAERRHARRIDGLLAILGLRPHAEKYVSELSTAMRRIVDIACVTATNPTVLLLDEPSSGLAQAEAEELGPLLRRLVAETGYGLLIIEHDIPLVASISDRMIAMDLGRVIAEGTPDEVVANEQVARAALGGRDDVIARTDVRKA